MIVLSIDATGVFWQNVAPKALAVQGFISK